MPTLTLAEAEDLVVRTLTRCRTDADNAKSVARALVGRGSRRPEGSWALAPAELRRAGQSRQGRRHGQARARTGRGPPPRWSTPSTALPIRRSTWRSPPCRRPRARTASPRPASRARIIAASSAIRSSIWREKGLVALMFANTPAAIAPWGGAKAVFGTNPIAFACPLPGRAPIVVDLVAVEGGARQYSRRQAEGRENPGRLGARRRRQADHRCKRRARRHHAAARRRQGHGAGADGGIAGGRADRRQFRRRGVLLSQRRGPAAGHRPIADRLRSRCRSAARSRISPRSPRRSRRSRARGCRARGVSPRAETAAREGVTVTEALLAEIAAV